MKLKTRTFAVVLLAVSLWLGACEDDTPAPPEEPFEGTTGPSRLAPSPDPVQGAAILSDVSSQGAGTGGAYDRLRFEFDGTQRPELRVEYVPQATECGSGEAVTLPGSAVLQIAFQPANAHDDNGNVTVATRQLPGHGGPIQQTRLICDFEAHVTWAVGIDGRKPYRVVPVPNSNDVWVDISE